MNDPTPPTTDLDVLDVLIVGTGFAGLGMAIQLKRSGRDRFVLLEKSDGLGGTWRENHYPGCACDVPSHLYSFSFELRPSWRRSYAPQPEILDYLEHCADKYGIRPHIRFRQEVAACEFDDHAGLWTVRTRAGDEFRARHLVLGVGALHQPMFPKLPGLERFQGPRFHSAHWDHSVSMHGRRVGVVGTGASAIQFVPQLAAEAGRLHVFQRTPPWILPRPDRSYSRIERALFEALPGLTRAYRTGLYWKQEAQAVGFVRNPRVMKLAELMGRRHIRRQIADEALRRQVTPDYTAGCKRILLSNDYYPALARPNVELVTDPIQEVTERGIVTADGSLRELDAIVFGTGFHVAGPLARLRVVGRGGLVLTQAWRDAVMAYRGTMVSGFPNLYLMTGPNTGLGHNSMVFMIESQIRLVLGQIEALERLGAPWADVLPRAQAEWNAGMEPRHAKSVWMSGCRSWYLDRHGRNSALWPGFTFEFWAHTRRWNPRHFEIAHEAPAARRTA